MLIVTLLNIRAKLGGLVVVSISKLGDRKGRPYIFTLAHHQISTFQHYL